MMIAPWPTLQSWAMWLMAMMRQPSPTSVQPSARVARWIVTYSRSTVPAPILTPDGVPSLNFKSWGRPPSTEPWPIFTPRPSSTRPSSTQWWPTSTSAPIVASAPTIENAPILAAGWILAPGSTTAVGWTGSAIRRLPGAQPRLEGCEPPLGRTQPADDLRQLALEDEDPLGLQQGTRRRAEQLLARRDVLREAGLRGDHGTVTNRDVVGDAHLPGQHDAAADPARPRDSHLGHDDRVLTDLDVVADLHQVVDLGPAADDRLPERGAVDRRVRPNFDVVLDQHRAHLRDLPVRFAVEGVAEAVGANHRARVNHDALAERDPRAQGPAGPRRRAPPERRRRPRPALPPQSAHRRGRRSDRGPRSRAARRRSRRPPGRPPAWRGGCGRAHRG